MIKNQLRKFVVTVLVNMGAIYVASMYLLELKYENIWVLIAVAAVFSLVTILLKPIVKLIATPLLFLAPFLFFIVDAIILFGLGLYFPGFVIGDYITALIAGAIVGILSWIAHWLL